MSMQKVFVAGAGLMGSGIAQICAQHGMRVFLYDISRQALERGLGQISWSLGKLIEKGKLTGDQNSILSRIQVVADFSDGAGVDMAIEAVFEKLEVKQEVFRQLDAVCDAKAILASNTSAIPITELAAVTGRPEKVLGIHFFSPVPMMPAAEVVKGMLTSEQTMDAAVAFLRQINKDPIRVESDVPGFLLNRINLVSYVEAIRLLEQGIGTVEEIDRGVRLAFGRRMGPFETGDMVGLDVSFAALMAIYEESQDSRFYPPQLLRRKVKVGQLGRKTGSGWYVYDSEAGAKD